MKIRFLDFKQLVANASNTFGEEGSAYTQETFSRQGLSTSRPRTVPKYLKGSCQMMKAERLSVVKRF
jgi:hypothetical protein